jgi:hypothetical protein
VREKDGERKMERECVWERKRAREKERRRERGKERVSGRERIIEKKKSKNWRAKEGRYLWLFLSKSLFFLSKYEYELFRE